MVLLAPAYGRTAEAAAPALPRPGVVFNTQSQTEFIANWDRQVGCANQYHTAVRDVVWSEMLASDPVGSTWGTGVRRGLTSKREALSEPPSLRSVQITSRPGRAALLHSQLRHHAELVVPRDIAVG